MPLLQPNDSIGFIAPSSISCDKDLTPAISYFNKLGLQVVLADNISKKYRYMAGTDEERLNAIHKMYANPSIKALFCVRGGAGATRLLDKLDYNLIKNNPKPIIGLSDSTALQNAVFTKTQNPALTGFLPIYDFNNHDIDTTVSASLISALFEDSHTVTSGNCAISGKATGKIIGGCLSVLCYLCGTPYFPDLTNKILLLEDVGEKTYKVDLMLNQLKQQKNFNKLKAIIFGNFTNCHISSSEDGTIDDCINDFIKGLNIPVITNFAYGHIPSRYILPLGISVKLNATQKKCTITW